MRKNHRLIQKNEKKNLKILFLAIPITMLNGMDDIIDKYLNVSYSMMITISIM